MTIVSPSFLSANFLDLSADIERFNQSKAQWLHYDVMDGNFVPNISFGTGILKQIVTKTDKFIDVHIMVTNPKAVIDYFQGIRVDMFTFHYEALKDEKEIREVIAKIHSLGIKAGISVKPDTPIEVLENILNQVDMVLIMSVHPGFGGQKFIAEMLDKADWLANQRTEKGLDFIIQIDGGINQQTAQLAKQHHVDCLVAGSYCFNHPQGFSYSVDCLLGE